MKHYWLLGLFGLALYGIAQHARGNWFQNDDDHMTEVVGHDATSHEFHWTGRVVPGATVEIKGINGSVVAESTAGDQVEVVAVKRGRRSDPSTVRIEMVEHAGGVTFCAVYPHRRDPHVCAPGDAGHLGGENNDVNVSFRVRVPDRVALAARLVNGGVTAEGLSDHVYARTVNGSVKIATDGAAEAFSTNGSITARVGANDTDGLQFQTVNGSITLDLPEAINAVLSGGTVGGGIASDFPLTVQGRYGPKNFRVVLGDGGEPIEVRTTNGSIRILRND